MISLHYSRESSARNHRLGQVALPVGRVVYLYDSYHCFKEERIEVLWCCLGE